MQALWNLAQIVFLAGLAWLGYAPQLYRLDVVFDIHPTKARICIDPVFVVEVDHTLLQTLSGDACVGGGAFGNIILLDASLEGWLRKTLLAHELVHVSQFRALGPWILTICAICPKSLEPMPELNARHAQSMWCPPPAWNSWPSFSLSFALDKP